MHVKRANRMFSTRDRYQTSWTHGRAGDVCSSNPVACSSMYNVLSISISRLVVQVAQRQHTCAHTPPSKFDRQQYIIQTQDGSSRSLFAACPHLVEWNPQKGSGVSWWGGVGVVGEGGAEGKAWRCAKILPVWLQTSGGCGGFGSRGSLDGTGGTGTNWTHVSWTWKQACAEHDGDVYRALLRLDCGENIILFGKCIKTFLFYENYLSINWLKQFFV